MRFQTLTKTSGQMDRISKMWWFARRDGLVGQGEYFELNSEGNGQPVERVTTGGARCKATSPGDHPGKTVLHFLDLEHVPNCDTMQQGVAVVKATGHKSRRQALGLVQVQMCY